MYAIIESGGKQIRVAPHQFVRVERIIDHNLELVEGKPQGLQPGTVHKFDRVLLVREGASDLHIGQPTVSDGYVVGYVSKEAKGKKLIAYKFKRRKKHRRKQGHRQPFTELFIRGLGTGEIPAELLTEELTAEELAAIEALRARPIPVEEDDDDVEYEGEEAYDDDDYDDEADPEEDEYDEANPEEDDVEEGDDEDEEEGDDDVADDDDDDDDDDADEEDKA